jgi:hypothetical protein
MNGTIISEDKLLEIKELAKEIETLNTEIMCFGGTDNLYFQLRMKTQELTKLILEL